MPGDPNEPVYDGVVVGERPFTHTFSDNILGEIRYTKPWKMTYVYDDAEDYVVYKDVVKLQVMKTGCYVLHFKGSPHVVVVAPGHHRYHIAEPMQEAET